MVVFDFVDYKLFVNKRVQDKPKNGRGEYKRIADYLGVSSVLISQIFKGPKDLSMEQAFKTCEYFGLIELEKKYFLGLVSLAKAGTFELKKHYEKELEDLKQRSLSIENRVKHSKVLSEEDKGIFYSDWRFSAIRLSCELEDINTIEDLSQAFSLEPEQVKKYTDFLLKTGLIKVNSGKFALGPSSTHLSSSSPYIKNHHRNWRLKAIESIDQMGEKEIMYSAPMSVSKKVFENLNKKILKLIDEFVEEASDTEAQDLYFLNIDLRKTL